MASAPRFFVPVPLHAGALVHLPAGATRHVQVLRMQPGDVITLFGPGRSANETSAAQTTIGGEYEATITTMGRQEVTATVLRHHAVSREAQRNVVLALGMPANERMDWLVEKATELGASAIQPLMTERTVLRLDAERARKKTTHWNSIVVAACEQCGRNTVPVVHDAITLAQWLKTLDDSAPAAASHTRCLLSFQPGTVPLGELAAVPGASTTPQTFTVLGGPEGGLSGHEEALAMERGFIPVTLGNRVLRAETAVLAALTLLA